GLCVGHVAPEAVDGGPIAFLRDGDRIRLDVGKGTLDVLVDPAEFDSRKEGVVPLPPVYRTGVLAKYTKLVGSAAGGAVCSKRSDPPQRDRAHWQLCGRPPP